MESEPPGAAFFLPGDGADPIWSEPEWAPGPWTSGAGAAQRSSGSATLVGTNEEDIIQNFFCFIQGGARAGPSHRLRLRKLHRLG